MTAPDTSAERHRLADRLQAGGHLSHPAWRAAVEAVPRELFLQPGVFLPTDDGRWRPVTVLGTDPREWVEIAYSDQSLVTQLDGHLTADQVPEPITGFPTSFMPARSEAPVPLSGDLAARAAYADTERKAEMAPDLLDEWTPTFLAQLAAPGVQLIRAATEDGQETVYLFDTARESFAALTPDKDCWTVRQGGPVALWDAIEEAVTAWKDADQPHISAVHVKVTPQAHAYWIGETSTLRWEHRLT